ncbi:MAG: hypothetical protein FWD34_09655 [Oscillospiraceae bacterium]|nr:hypothetical protein [Oscillospiraceae bacterium]
MRLFKYELYKVLTKKMFWGMLIAALTINVLALWFINRPSYEEITHLETKEIYDLLRPMNLEEKLAWLQDEVDLMDAYFIKESLYSFSTYRNESVYVRDTGIRVKGKASSSNDDYMTEYIAELQAQYDEARERFGERLNDDIPWQVINARKMLCQSIIYDLTKNTYSSYLDRIDDEADKLLGSSIFGSDPDSFSSRNIAKTQDDFKDMRGVIIQHDVHKGISILFDSPSADLIILLLIIAICIALITDEKDKRLFLIVRATPKGHIHTILAKMAALTVCVTFVSVLVFISSVFFAEYTYGLGDVLRSVQSVPMFVGSTLQISVIGFMGLNLLLKTLALVLIGLTVMLIAIHSRHSILLMLITVVVAAVNVLLSAVPVISDLNILRFLNLYSLIRPHVIFGDYFNLNMFGFPVKLALVFAIFACMVFIGLIIGICVSYLKKQDFESNLNMFKLKKIRLLPARVHTGYKFYEFKKLAFTNKAVVILAVFAIIQGYNVYNTQEPYLGYDHQYIKNMLTSLQGPVTREKHDYLTSEKAKLDEAQNELHRLNMEYMMGEIDPYLFFEERRPYDSIVNSMWGFNEIYERYQYIRNTDNAQFVYDTGYVWMFGMNNPDAGLTSGIWLCAIIILSLCGLFSMEYKTGMYKILNASPHGHGDTVKLKLMLSAGLVVIAFIIASLPELIYIGRYFGYSGMGAPLASIPPAYLGGFPAFMGIFPIWTYVLFMLFMRLIATAGVAVIVLALSLKLKNNAYAALVGAGVLLAPLFMYRLGLDMIRPFSVAELITANGLIVEPSFLKAAQVILFLIITGCCGWYVTKKFGRS